jgi:hypothetical protein
VKEKIKLMTAVFTDFDSSMASRIVVDSEAGHVDVTFRSTDTTYRFNLSNADIADIMSVIATRSKGRLLHQLLDIRNGVRLPDAVQSNVAVPNVTKKTVTKTSTKSSVAPAKKTPAKVVKSSKQAPTSKKVATR